MDEPHKDFKVTKDGIQEVHYEKATSGDCKNYGVTAAVLIDKFRLEIGEATSRNETVTKDETEAQLAEIVTLRKKG